MTMPRAFFTFVSLLIYFLFSSTAKAATPVAIECPCSVSRLNPTSVEINFNLVFTQDVRKSAPIEVYLHGMTVVMQLLAAIMCSPRLRLVLSIFSTNPSPINVRVPFYATGFDSGYLSLVLVDRLTGEIFDISPLTAQPISVSMDAGAVFRSAFDEVFFENKPTFEVADKSYSFSALNFTRRSIPLPRNS